MPSWDLPGLVVEADEDARVERQDDHVIVHAERVRLRPDATPTRFYRHGWQSWSQTRWLSVDEPTFPVPVEDLRVLDDDPVHALDEHHGGSGVGALDGSNGVAVLGCVELDARVELEEDSIVGTRDDAGDWLIAFGEEREVFATYARELAARLGAREPIRDLRVWCSWYSFYTHITEPEIDRVLAGLKDLDFDVVQIDDGWQREIGDWQVNDDFPSGMRALAQRIIDAGFRPGLWLAPFLVHERSQTLAEHPEWLLHGDHGPVSAGWNWGGRIHALDVTHPNVLNHVANIARTAVEWGFTYLKLDFLYAAGLPGNRHANVGREEGYRAAVERIREAVGPDVLLLACGAPVLASVGVFDAIRIGPDVAEIWEVEHITRYLHYLGGPQARYAVATSAHRLWLADVIGADPDVAYFRSRDCLLSDEQKDLVIDLTRICRFRATSDDPDSLDPDERRRLTAYLREAVNVVTLGAHRYRIGDREVDFRPVANEPPPFRRLGG